MADRALDVYLNDHLAGAMLGSDLAEQIHARNQGTTLGKLMASLAPQIEEDRQTLISLMDRLDSAQNPVKQATTWMAEKVSRAKFSGLTSGEPELAGFMALEALALGVQGKKSLWLALKEVRGQYAPLASINLHELIERAQAQSDALEVERLASIHRLIGLLFWVVAERSRCGSVKRLRGSMRGVGGWTGSLGRVEAVVAAGSRAVAACRGRSSRRSFS